MIRQTMRKWAYKWTEPPFLPLTGAPLLIMATTRLSYALIAIGAIVWVFMLITLVCRIFGKILPRFGRKVIFIMLSSFFASLYYLLLYLTHPALACECSLIIAFIPAIFCILGFEHDWAAQNTPVFSVIRSLFEYLVSISIMIAGFALIREPLGYASLSFPGGPEGITGFFDSGALSSRTVQIASQAVGALLLLGYLLAVFRRFNHDRDTGIHPEQKNTPAAIQNAPQPKPVSKPVTPDTKNKGKK